MAINKIQINKTVLGGAHEVCHPTTKAKNVKCTNPYTGQPSNLQDTIDYIATTPIIWSTINLPTTLEWSAVGQSGDRIILLAKNSRHIIYSDNGKNWTLKQNALPVARNWTALTDTGKYWIAVASGTNMIAYSTDGLSWSETRVLSDSADWSSIAYGHSNTFGTDIYIGIAKNSDKFIYYNRFYWGNSTLPIISNWSSIAVSGSRWIIVSDNLNQCIISSFGDDDVYNMPAGNIQPGYKVVKYLSNKYIALPTNGNIGAWSTTGKDFASHQIVLPGAQQWKDLTYGNNRYIAIGNQFGAHSKNGTTWKKFALPNNRQWDMVTYFKNNFIMFSKNSNQIVIGNALR